MESLDAFLQSIAEAFSPTREHILNFVFVVIGLIFVAIVANRLLRRTERVRFVRTLETKYQSLLRKYNLTIREIDLLSTLATYLKDPAKKYVLLLNQQTLSACLQSHRTRGSRVDDETVTLLEDHLGFAIDEPPERPRSTRDLQAGSAVRLRSADGSARSGIIASSDRWSLQILLDDSHGDMKSGATMRLFAGDFRSIIVFAIRIVRVEGRQIAAEHSDTVEQAHELDRPLKTDMDVLVRTDDSQAKPIKTTILELRSGGCIAVNPDKKFRRDDDVRIYFPRAKNSWRQVNAEVEALTNHRSMMRLRFSHLRQDVWEEFVGRASRRTRG